MNLLSTILNEKNIKSTLILLLLDLSNPTKIIENLINWISSIKSIINEKISETVIQEIVEAKKIKYEKQNIDSKNLLPIEITVLFTKYETLETLEMFIFLQYIGKR